MMRSLRAPALLAFLLIAATLEAQQLITNPGFESVPGSEWTLAGVGTGGRDTVTFYAGSASARLTNNSMAGNTTYEQCVAVTNGSMYNWGAWSFVQSGSDPLSKNQVQLYWCNSATCNSCSFSPGPVSSTMTNTWEHLTVTGTMAQDNFGKLVIRASANSTIAYTGYFDGMFLGIGITSPVELQGFSAE